MNKQLSNKLVVLSFALMIMVVYLHANNLVFNFNNSSLQINLGYNSIIQNFISNGITRIAVPLFFIVSGYLFFLNAKDFDLKIYKDKLLKRIKTLLIPFVFWSAFGILLYFILQTIPASKPYFTKELIINYSLNQFITTLFYNPIPYQFWFIRDLILLVIISPIIYLALKYLKWIFIVLVFIVWFVNYDIIVLSNEALLFFAVGSFIAIENFNFKDLKTTTTLLLTAFWLILIVLKLYFEFFLFNVMNAQFIHKLSIIIGICAFWFLLDLILQHINLKKTGVIKLSFFLFATHEPILTILKKLLYVILGTTEQSSFIIFILSPLITIGICLFLGYYFKSIFPKSYSFVTGGR